MALGERLGATSSQALMTPFAVVVEYARLLVWPVRLSPDYSYNQIPLVTSAVDVRFIGGLAIVACCVYGIVALWRRHPLAAFGLAFLAVTFSVVSNVVITIGTICAERLMYLPSAGFLIAAAAGVERATEAKPDLRRAVVRRRGHSVCARRRPEPGRGIPIGRTSSRSGPRPLRRRRTAHASSRNTAGC